MKRFPLPDSLLLLFACGLSTAVFGQDVVPAFRAESTGFPVVQAIYTEQPKSQPVRQVQYQQPLDSPTEPRPFRPQPTISLQGGGVPAPGSVVPAIQQPFNGGAVSPLPQPAVPHRPLAAEAVSKNYRLRNITGPTLESKLIEKLGTRFVPVKNVENSPNLGRFRLPVKDGTDVELSIDRPNGVATVLGSAPMVDATLQLVQLLDAANGGTLTTEVVSVQRANIVPVKQATETIVKETNKEPLTQIPLAQPTAPAIPLAQSTAPAIPLAQPTAPAIPLTQPTTPQFRRPSDEATARFSTPNVQNLSIPGGEGNSGGIVGPIQIDVIDGLDTIVVRGPKKDVSLILDMINQIEAMSLEHEPVLELVDLKNADSYRVSQMVQQLYQQIYQARRGSVTMLPLVKPNTILLIGKKESVDTAKELIAKLDTPVAPETEFLVIRLKNSSSDAVQTYLTNFYSNRQNLGAQVLVVSDYRTNSLIIQGSPRDLTEAAALVKQLDAEGGDAVNTVKTFQLRNAMASELATTLQNAISGTTTGSTGLAGTGGGAAAQSGRTRTPALQLGTVDANGNFLKANVLLDVRVTADTRSNTLIVSAPTETMPLVEALIKELDQLPSAESQIKVFTLNNGDASTLTTVLTTLFQQTTQTGGGFGGGGTQASSQIATVRPGIDEGESTLVSVRFATDTRTNSIIACGSAGDMSIVEAILLRLDEENSNNRKVMVFKLVNKPADQLALVLQQYITNERQLDIQNSGTFYPQSPQEQYRKEVVIVAEPLSNSLIVSSTPRYAEQIRKIVHQLDERPLMVAIQVLIAEVTMKNNREFGVEFGLQDSLLFDRSLMSGTPSALRPGFLFGDPSQGLPLGNVNPGSVGSQGITSLNVGRSGESGATGFLFSASSESVSILIRALEEDSRVRILSRPQVTTLHNLRATIQIGQKVPYVTGTNTSVGGTTSNTTSWMDVGVILDVTPRITPDGMIVMDLYAEKSKVGPLSEGIPIGSAGNVPLYQPRIDLTKAQTTVSAMNGQTIVFAGLITENKEAISRSVPFLNKIPVVKHLFEYKQNKRERSEMLIVMTPTIIRNEMDMEIMKQQEASRMHWCISDVMKFTGNSNMRLRTDDWSNCDIETQVFHGDPVILNETQLPSEEKVRQQIPMPMFAPREN